MLVFVLEFTGLLDLINKMYITNVNKINAKARIGISKKEYNQYLFNCFLRKFGRAIEQEHDKIIVIDGNEFHVIKNEYGKELSCISLKKIEDFV